MKIYSYKNINYIKSIKYYNIGVNDNIIKDTSCYENVYNMLPYVIDDDGDLLTCYKIGYCYVGNVTTVKDKIPLKRHCVIVTPLYEIIDVTILKYGLPFFKKFLSNNNIQFLMFAELNIMEYYSSIENDNYNLQLRYSLCVKEKSAWDYMYKQNLSTNDFLYNKYKSNAKIVDR